MTIAIGEPLALLRLASGRREYGMAIPASVALHGVVVAAIAFGWSLGAGSLLAESPMDVMVVMVVMEPAAAIEAPTVERARSLDVAALLLVAEPPPPVQAADIRPAVELPPEPPALVLPEPETLPPPVTEAALVMPTPPPKPPVKKPATPPPDRVVAPAPPPVQPAPVRETPRQELAAAPAADPGPPSPATAPNPQAAAAPPAAPAPSFRGLPLLTEPRFREPPRQPAYPRRAVDLDQKGTVIVRALVDAAGTPAAVEIWTSSGFPMLDRAAELAVRQWRFQPATYDARPTEAWVQVAVHFNLR